VPGGAFALQLAGGAEQLRAGADRGGQFRRRVDLPQPLEQLLVLHQRPAAGAAGDEDLLGWLREVDRATKWTTSVCTGSLLLGAAGLLEGKRATGHWLYLDALREFGADPVGGRYVEDGKTITAAGVSAGIDMALYLVSRELGPEVAQAVQLGVEYDPSPPFDAGSPEKAPQPIVELVTSAIARS
jgi:transcriptional regulator GlxA family with amidase domain